MPDPDPSYVILIPAEDTTYEQLKGPYSGPTPDVLYKGELGILDGRINVVTIQKHLGQFYVPNITPGYKEI